TPDAIAKAIPSGIATTPTVIPAIKSLFKSSKVKPLKRSSLSNFIAHSSFTKKNHGEMTVPIILRYSKDECGDCLIIDVLIYVNIASWSMTYNYCIIKD